MTSCKDDLVALGPCRESRDQQFRYLLGLATRYQKITDQALEAHYRDPVFGSDGSLRLATVIIRRNEIFANDIVTKGHTYEFKSEVQSAEDSAASEEGEVIGCRYEDDNSEIENIVEDICEICEPSTNGIKLWLKSIYQDSRGFTMGTFDASLLTIAWRQQSANWDGLCLGYIYDIVSLVHSYTVNLLSIICNHERIRRGLISVLLDRLLERYTKGIDQAKRLLSVERAGTPLTLNHYFSENLDK